MLINDGFMVSSKEDKEDKILIKYLYIAKHILLDN